MKIVFMNNYYYLRGGSERVFFDEMEILKLHGHEIVSFSRHYEKNFNSNFVSFFPSFIEYENVSILRKITTGLKLIYSLEAKDKITKMINHFMPDIIHAHNIYGRLTSSVLDAAKDRDIPVVMTLHDYKLICPSYSMLLNGRSCERCKGGRFYNCLLTRCHKGSLSASAVYTIESYFNRLFKKYDHIKYFICPSRFLLIKHLESGLPEEKLIHISNFIRVEKYDPNYKHENYILYAGRLSKEKGIMTLLKAVNGLEVSLKIAGDGPMREEYETYAKGNQLLNVLFEGYKTGDELRELFRNAAFIVFPSECYENAPMTILEAFAYGKPVIGSNIGGIPEMVVEGETGLLFGPGNPDELREKILYLLSNPSLIEAMSRKAREKTETEFNAEIHYKRLMEIYKAAIS